MGTPTGLRPNIHSSRSRFAARLSSGVMRCCKSIFRSSSFGRLAAIFSGRRRLAFPTLTYLGSFIASPLALWLCGAPIAGGFDGDRARVPGNASGSSGW
jgi:hypothetical protein